MGAACSGQPGGLRVLVADTSSLASVALFSGMKHPHDEELEQVWKKWLEDWREQRSETDAMVAPTMRWICWPMLLHAPDLIDHDMHHLSSSVLSSALAGSRVFEEVASSLQVADRDVPRTAPDLQRMATAKKTLRRTLRAAASADHGNAYVQSQNFLAMALVLAGVRSQSAAACLLALFRTRGCAMGDLYKEKLELPRILARAVIILLQRRARPAYDALVTLEGISDVKVLPWIMACGAGSTLPWSSKLLTVDRLVLEVARAQRNAATLGTRDGEAAPTTPPVAEAEPLPWLQADTRAAILHRHSTAAPAGPEPGATSHSFAAAASPTDVTPAPARATSGGAPLASSQDGCPPLTVVACALAALRGYQPQLVSVTRAGHTAASRVRTRPGESYEARKAAASSSVMVEGCMACLQDRWLEGARHRLEADDGGESTVAALPGPDSKVLTRRTGRKESYPIAPAGVAAAAPAGKRPSGLAAAPAGKRPSGLVAAPAGASTAGLEDGTGAEGTTGEHSPEARRVERPRLEVAEPARRGARISHLDIESSASNSDSEYDADTKLPEATASLPRTLRTPHREAIFRAESQSHAPLRITGRLKAAVDSLIRSPPPGSRIMHRPGITDLTVVDGQLCWLWMHPRNWGPSLDSETAWLREPTASAPSRLHQAARQAAKELGLPVPEWCRLEED
jgi:hypothetical protein